MKFTSIVLLSLLFLLFAPGGFNGIGEPLEETTKSELFGNELRDLWVNNQNDQFAMLIKRIDGSFLINFTSGNDSAELNVWGSGLANVEKRSATVHQFEILTSLMQRIPLDEMAPREPLEFGMDTVEVVFFSRIQKREYLFYRNEPFVSVGNKVLEKKGDFFSDKVEMVSRSIEHEKLIVPILYLATLAGLEEFLL